jgi:leucyl aminopeptidase
VLHLSNMAERRLLPASAALALLVCGCSDTTTPSSTWQSARTLKEGPVRITTDRAGARVLQARSERVSLASDQVSDLVVLEVERADLSTLSQGMHDELHRCGGFMLERSLPAALAATSAPPPLRTLQADYVIDNDATVTALLAPLQESNLRQTIQSLADFPTRLHSSETGLEASHFIRDRWQSYIQGRADVKAELVEHEETPQPSISLTIQGSKYPDELVILGGHMDSINRSNPLAPGADDNASGIAALDEVARAALLLGYRPERTVIFYAYAAEEIGLVGSGEIAQAAEDQELNVIGVLQFDMTNFNPNPNPYVAIVTDYTDPTLNQFARQLIEKYVKVPWKDTECGYACSDHASWQRRGFPVHYVHEATTDESNEDIHTVRDTLALSNGSAQHTLHFARYAAAFMAETAKGTIPECDANRPCAGGNSCQAGACVPAVGVGGAGGSAGAAGLSGGSGSGGMSGSGGAAGSDMVGSSGSAGTLGGMAAVEPLPPAGSPSSGGATTEPSPGAYEPAACSCRAPGSTDSSAAAAAALLLAALADRRRPQTAGLRRVVAQLRQKQRGQRSR